MALQKINGRDLTKKSFIKLIQKISSDPLDN